MGWRIIPSDDFSFLPRMKELHSALSRLEYMLHMLRRHNSLLPGERHGKNERGGGEYRVES